MRHSWERRVSQCTSSTPLSRRSGRGHIGASAVRSLPMALCRALHSHGANGLSISCLHLLAARQTFWRETCTCLQNHCDVMNQTRRPNACIAFLPVYLQPYGIAIPSYQSNSFPSLGGEESAQNQARNSLVDHSSTFFLAGGIFNNGHELC